MSYLRSLPLLALGLCGFMVSQQASAEIKIGYVDFQKLMAEAPQVKSAMQAMQNDLKASDEKLTKEGAIMAEADRAKAEKALRDQQREFSRKGGEFQDDLSTRKNEELGKVQRYLLEEIRTYSTAQGFDLVLGEGVFYSKPQLDITAQVLYVLKSKPATAPKPAAAAPAKPPGAK